MDTIKYNYIISKKRNSLLASYFRKRNLKILQINNIRTKEQTQKKFDN